MMRLRTIPGMLLLALASPAQQPADQRPEDQAASDRPVGQHRLPSGLRLNAISIYGQEDWLRPPQLNPGVPAEDLWFLTGGAAGDLGLYLGRLNTFSIVYHGGYSYNRRYSMLNGANHGLSIDFATDPGRRTVFTLGATGDTGLVSDAIFDPSYILSVTRQAQSLTDLERGILGGNEQSVIDSAVELALSGGRRMSGGAHASISRIHSRRLSSQAEVSMVREIHSYSPESSVSARYPNVTLGMANLRLTYSLARRTRLVGALGYTRSISQQFRSQWEAAGLGIEREFGRRSFGSAQAGYVRLGDMHGEPGRSTYMVSGAYGTSIGSHTFAFTGHRSAGDVHGLGASSTVGGNGVWSWRSLRNAWIAGGSIGYERLGEIGTARIQAWVSQINVTRRLSPHFDLAVTAVYVAHMSSDLQDLSRAGVRLCVIWRPTPEVRR
jgi:hypothetical protein